MRLGWVDLLYIVWGISTSIKNIGGMLPDYWGGYIPPGFAPMVIGLRYKISLRKKEFQLMN